MLAKRVNRRELVLDRKLRDATALAYQKSIRGYHDRVRPIFRQSLKRCVESCAIVDRVDHKRTANPLRPLTRALERKRQIAVGGIGRDSGFSQSRDRLFQQLQ